MKLLFTYIKTTQLDGRLGPNSLIIQQTRNFIETNSIYIGDNDIRRLFISLIKMVNMHSLLLRFTSFLFDFRIKVSGDRRHL